MYRPCTELWWVVRREVGSWGRGLGRGGAGPGARRGRQAASRRLDQRRQRGVQEGERWQGSYDIAGSNTGRGNGIEFRCV